MYLDLLLLFLILLFGFLGYLHGFVKQTLHLLGVICIAFFAQPLALWLKNSSGWAWFSKSPMFVLWGLSAIAIILVFFAVGGIVSLMRESSTPSPGERWIGCALGVAKGIFICFVAGALYHTLP